MDEQINEWNLVSKRVVIGDIQRPEGLICHVTDFVLFHVTWEAIKVL